MRFLVDSKYRSLCAELICLVEGRNQENLERFLIIVSFPVARTKPVMRLAETDRRAFDLLMDGKVILSNPAAWSPLAHHNPGCQQGSQGLWQGQADTG